MLLHVGAHHFLRQEVRSAEVHVHHAVEHLGRHIIHRYAFEDGGVIHQDVDLAEEFKNLGDRFPARVDVA